MLEPTSPPSWSRHPGPFRHWGLLTLLYGTDVASHFASSGHPGSTEAAAAGLEGAGPRGLQAVIAETLRVLGSGKAWERLC